MKTHPTIATYHRLLNELDEIERREALMEDDERASLTEKAAELQRTVFNMEREQAESVTKKAVMEEAGKMGVIDPESAYVLVDLAEITEDPASVSKALKKLVADKPYLVGPPPGPPPSPGIPAHGARLPRPPMSSNEAWLAMLKGGLNR